MTVELLRCVLGWSIVINFSMMLFWFIMIVLFKDLVYKWHSRFFKISKEKFAEIHYSGIMYYKLMVFFFNLVPYIAIIMSSCKK